jgi:hypothetical protein
MMKVWMKKDKVKKIKEKIMYGGRTNSPQKREET